MLLWDIRHLRSSIKIPSPDHGTVLERRFAGVLACNFCCCWIIRVICIGIPGSACPGPVGLGPRPILQPHHPARQPRPAQDRRQVRLPVQDGGRDRPCRQVGGRRGHPRKVRWGWLRPVVSTGCARYMCAVRG